MLPSIFGENLFDDFFSDPFGMMVPQGRDPLYGKHGKNLMKTDVRETENSYELDIDLPGFKKDEVNVELKNGYLTIQAAKGLDKEEQDKKGKYIRQERYAGACSRSFYVGEDVEPEEVSAKFEDGILTISVPKAAKKQLPKQTPSTFCKRSVSVRKRRERVPGESRGPFFACRDVSGSGAAGRTQGVLRYGNAHAGGGQ